MPRHVKRDQRDLAYHQLFAVGNELVELRTVARELGAFVEYLPEHTLDGDDFPTDDELAAKLFLKIGRGRKVIGMGMGLENPVDCEALFPNMGNDLVGGLEARPSGGLIEVPHAVDDRGPLCDGITDHVTCGEGRLMEKWPHLWRPQISSHYTPDLSDRLLNNGVVGHCSSPIGLAPVGSRPVPDKKDIEEA